ncbi:MAG TPA: hypothetical protein VGM89_19885 [Puia sp.]
MLVNIYVAFIGIAFLSSLNAFRLDLPLHLKIFSLLLACDLVVEVCSTFLLGPVFHMRSNVQFYNVFMLVEYFTYAWFYRTILKNRLLRRLIGAYLILFPIFWFVAVFFVFGFDHWNSYLSIVGSFFTVCMAVAFYYQLFTAPQLTRLTVSPEFWISTGVIIFYTCNLPYLGMLNFITKEYLPLARKLLMLLQVLNIIMYSLFTLAFLCRTRTMKLSSY